MKFTSFLIFGAGVALGVGATCAVKSRRGRKLAIALDYEIGRASCRERV